MSVPSEAEYNAAKQRQLDNVRAFSAKDPTEDVLADVAVINAYESAQPG